MGMAGGAAQADDPSPRSPVMRWKTLCCAAITLLVPLPGLARGPHVDLINYPQPEANWDRAYRLEAALAREFNAICADTWLKPSTSSSTVQ